MADNVIPADTEVRIARSSDKKLHDFLRPIVAVDIALLTIDPDRRQLQVVEMEREDIGKWALPGTLLRARETLAEAVDRCLRDKIGVQGVRPQQLGVFDDPDRDHRDWVISVAHVAVVRPDHLESLGSGAAYDTRRAPVDRPGELVWDHPKIVRLAKEYVRSRYQAEPDPNRLLGRRFTLSELQRVHEAIAGEDFSRFAFRRAMEPHLIDTGDVNEDTGSRGRPARLFRRRRDRG
jgi:ADP-ribose pyrophosphatase YjhB (NUDIX family)